jgi:plastocyanin
MRIRAFAAPFALALVGALALAGCGGSSDGDSGSSAAATVPSGALVVTAVEGIAWDSKTYAATAVDGKVEIAAKNDSSLPHNLHIIDSDNVDVGLSLSMSNKGDVKTGSVALAPGTYQVICTIAGHGNMKSTLTVS